MASKPLTDLLSSARTLSSASSSSSLSSFFARIGREIEIAPIGCHQSISRFSWRKDEVISYIKKDVDWRVGIEVNMLNTS